MAFVQLGNGRILCGFGPFEEREAPLDGTVCFYWNDFGLSDERPWKVPREAREFGSLRELASAMGVDGAERSLSIAWEDPSAREAGFLDVFARCRERIERGVCDKAVPAVVQRGRRVAGRLRELLLAEGLGGGALRGYGHVRPGGAGFVGLTPEMLFHYDRDKRRLETMALAGTAAVNLASSLSVDRKQLHEHGVVVDDVVERLQGFGEVEVGELRVLNVGLISHLLTPLALSVDPTSGLEVLDAVVRRLHPTPALGVFPRTTDNWVFLESVRAEAGVPPAFGAPFGVWNGEVCEMLVSIRAVYWDRDEISIPAGCGIIEESDPAREWEEIQLKWGAVRVFFGI